ncbi:MAG: hypothetical protein QXS93_04070 [Candidatus Micrarchaeia archaeon]
MNLKNYLLAICIFSLLTIYPVLAISSSGAAKSNAQNEIQNEIREQNEASTGKGTGIEEQERVRTEQQQATREKDGNGTGTPTEAVQAREQERNRSGISEQVHAIIESRKNGTIDVPQGMLVRIIASNRSAILEDVPLAINETLRVRVRANNRDMWLEAAEKDDGVIINDAGVRVRTRENLRIENGTLHASSVAIRVLPSEISQKTRIREMKSVELRVANGIPQYAINATRRAKLLWLFDADMDVEMSVDAVNGTIINEKRPWWSFLASTD